MTTGEALPAVRTWNTVAPSTTSQTQASSINSWLRAHPRSGDRSKNFGGKQKPLKSKDLSGFPGAARQIRTADLILTKRPWSFFLTIFNVLWSYSLRLACFPSLFKKKVSACSVAVCGWLCGQSAEGEDFRDFHRLHKYGQITVFLTCRSTFAVVLTKNLHKNFFFILIAECFTNTNQLS